MFYNPLAKENFSDPFMTYDAITGYYYFLSSCNDRMILYRSVHAGDILQKGEKSVVYACGENGVFGPMWAPEMYRVGNRWYIYTSCQEKPADSPWTEKKRLLILKSKTADPFDGFVFGAKPDTSMFAIDPTFTVYGGEPYLCYSLVAEDGVQVLQIRKMQDPMTFTAQSAVISRPSLAWEQVAPYVGNHAINEGAFFLQNKGRLFIIYSANGCWSDDYCLGVLEYTGGDLCDEKNWIKHPQPLFTKGNGIYGVGHASFFRSPDETEVWCAYHCLLQSNPKCEETVRYSCIQKIDFDTAGFPVMGAPVGTQTSLVPPSGEER